MKLRTFVLLAACIGFFAHDGKSQQTCSIPTASFSATGASQTNDNRALQCVGWRMAYFSEGFSVVSVQVDGAQDVNGAPGSFAAVSASGSCTLTGSNPTTSTGSGTVVLNNCYFPWIRISFTLTGTGTLTAGARGIGGVAASSISGGSGSGITGLTGDGTATGPGNVALTLKTVNGAPGACGDSTHVCQITTNGKGLTTSQTAVAISGGGGVSLTPPVQLDWTAFNSGGMVEAPTYTAANRFEFTSSVQAGDIIQGIATAIPAAPYTRTFRIWPIIGRTAFNFVGVGWADGAVGTPGKFVLCGLQMVSGGFGPVALNGTNYTNSTTFASSITQSVPWVGALQQVSTGVPIWIRLADNSTNWSCSVSWDGSNFSTLFSETRNTFATATQFEVFVSGNGSSNAGVIFDSFQ